MSAAELPEGVTVHNAQVDWDQWPVQRYLAENYRDLHPADATVIDHHSAWYRAIPADSVGLSLEFGAGPNLYPLMLAAGCSRRIHALEPSAANVAYLRAQLADGPDASWQLFYERCRRLNDALPPTLAEALTRVEVVPGDGTSVVPGSYDLASMHFVAEGVTESRAEFVALTRAFITSVRPGGYLVAAFMENLGRFHLGGRQWPSYPIGVDDVREAFGGYTDEPVISRIDDDPTLPAYGYTGMILLTARRLA
jgi:hypothetical protein